MTDLPLLTLQVKHAADRRRIVLGLKDFLPGRDLILQLGLATAERLDLMKDLIGDRVGGNAHGKRRRKLSAELVDDPVEEFVDHVKDAGRGLKGALEFQQIRKFLVERNSA